MSIKAVNPVTGEVIATHDEMTPPIVSEIVEAVSSAARDWRRASYADLSSVSFDKESPSGVWGSALVLLRPGPRSRVL